LLFFTHFFLHLPGYFFLFAAVCFVFCFTAVYWFWFLSFALYCYTARFTVCVLFPVVCILPLRAVLVLVRARTIRSDYGWTDCGYYPPYRILRTLPPVHVRTALCIFCTDSTHAVVASHATGSRCTSYIPIHLAFYPVGWFLRSAFLRFAATFPHCYRGCWTRRITRLRPVGSRLLFCGWICCTAHGCVHGWLLVVLLCTRFTYVLV